MTKLSCNSGDKFGEWTVIDPNYGSRQGHTLVKCICSCGRVKEINLTALVRGKTSKCKRCAARERTKKIAIGTHIKHWTILEGPIYINGYSKYRVRCDCGREYIKTTGEILDTNSNFQCAHCAQKENKEAFTFSNGRVGDLTLTHYTRLKRSAEKRHYEFSVSIKYLWNLFQCQHQICAITGDYIPTIKEASLDRIDSSKGYIEGNVQWVTIQANKCKHILTMPELYEFCTKVLKYANQKPSTPLTKCEGSETNS